MYLKTPYKNYAQVRIAIEKKEVVVRIARNKSRDLCGQMERGRIGVAFGFVLQIILPVSCIAVYGAVTKNGAAFLAVPAYCLLPFFFPLDGIVATVLTVTGLLGITLGWNEGIVAFLLPGIFYSWGKNMWWFFIQLGLIQEIMAGRETFERFWKQKLFALQDKGGIYRYED